MRRKPRIAVVGSLNMDLVLRTDRFPRPGETVAGGDLLQISGGKGANQAVAAARAGATVILVGAVGDDAAGKELVRRLRVDRIGVAAVERITGVPTGVAVILLDASGENQIIISPGANGRVTPRRVRQLRAVLKDVDLLLLQNEIPLAATRSAATLAKKLRVPVILNPAPAFRVPRAMLRKVTAVVVNETEARLIVGLPARGERAAREAVKRLAATVAGGIAVLTRGSRGALVAAAGGLVVVPPFQVEATDTTAAGDAFVGAFAVGLLRLDDPVEAAHFACAAGAIAATRLGAQTSLPRRQEVLDLLQTHRGAPGAAGGG